MKGNIYLIFYVENFLIISKPNGISDTKDNFKKLFTVVDLFLCFSFIGMKLDYVRDGVLLS